MSRQPKENRAETHGLGIPSVLKNIRLEKASEVCPVKLQFSLKKFLKKYAGAQGVSGWVREVIIEKLTREIEETS